MSPSWSEALRVGVEPGRISGARFSRGWKPRLLARHAIEHPGGAGAAAEDVAGALASLLKQLGGRGSVALVVSNRLVRYALVPWNRNVSGGREEIELARHCFSAIYGAKAESWELRLSAGRPGRARLASAVDKGLLDALRMGCARAGRRIASIQPYLMAVHNRERRVAADNLLVVAEEGFYTSLLVRNGEFFAVRSGVLDAPVDAEIPALIDRECAWSGLERRPAVALHPRREAVGAEAGFALAMAAP